MRASGLKMEEFNPKAQPLLEAQEGCSSTPMVPSQPQVAAGRVKRNGIRKGLSPQIIPLCSAPLQPKHHQCGERWGVQDQPQNTHRGWRGWQNTSKPLKRPQNRRGGGRGRHSCNNLLNEAIITTGKTRWGRGGPCSATCLVCASLWGGQGDKGHRFIAKGTLDLEKPPTSSQRQ